MKAFPEFADMPPEFWALVKLTSEVLGYTVRNAGLVKAHTASEIAEVCKKTNTRVSDKLVEKAARYSAMRAALLNDFVKGALMDAAAARIACEPLLRQHIEEGLRCKIPLNKQKGDMKQIAYFTAMINILAEKAIKHTPLLPVNSALMMTPTDWFMSGMMTET